MRFNFRHFFLILKMFLFHQQVSLAQAIITSTDSTINNLVHSSGYKTSQYGAIPQFIKKGNGKQAIILIPGLGFDATVFNDFMEANKKNYTMYAITIPGYGNTAAPPMPAVDTSYGDQSWNKGVEEGLIKLINKEKIERAIIAGHFVQGTQLALRMAIDYPDKVSGVIILGGPAKFILIEKGEPKEYPLKNTVYYIDKYTAPNWFKSISEKDFDDGNYLPGIYSFDTIKADQLWKEVSAVPLPVMVRYLCEFFASDVTLELDKIKCPVLVLRATFSDEVLKDPVNNYVRPQFIDSWNDATSKNHSIIVKDILAAAGFVWKDNPAVVYEEIKNFVNQR